MAEKKETVSFVFPVYNEEANLEPLYRGVSAACKEASAAYEMIFVDDGSTDRSFDLIKGLRQKDQRVRYVSLSRNFGHQNALFAGMAQAKGDAVITMDVDLQHPPSLIPEMIKMWKEGAEVVYTTKKNADLSMTDQLFFRAFYWLISKISAVELDFGQSDFRLLDRKVLKRILEIPEYHKFLRGQVKWLGFRQRGIPYDMGRRAGGTSKFSYRKRLAFALDGIFAFSRYPLHVVMMTGITIACISAAYIAFIFFVWLLNALRVPNVLPLQPGWSATIVGIFFLGSIQLIAIGILGEYIGRIYDQIKGRPVFVVRESSEEAANG